jgi:hypothetical protein
MSIIIIVTSFLATSAALTLAIKAATRSIAKRLSSAL